MDWTHAIEKHREALARILAMLVAMARLRSRFAPKAQSWRAGGTTTGGEGRDVAEGSGDPARMCSDRPTLPRHLHRLILRLLRPAESAVRRLAIVMARGLVVELAPARPRKTAAHQTFLRRPGGTGILLPPGARLPAIAIPGTRPAPRPSSLSMLDPLRRPLSLSKGRRRRPVQGSVPRISFPGNIAPSPIALRRPPLPDDPLDASRLALRLRALGAALDDLPRRAARFARWKARRQAVRRAWPLRPGRAPGQRPVRWRTHEVYEVLHDLHALAFEVLDNPDTS